VTDKIDLKELPTECNLLAVSNTYDLLIVGGNSGELWGSQSGLQAYERQM
jgi:hypothetical protein